MYEEDGPPTDDADIMLTSLPINVLEEFHIKATEEIAVKDKALLDDLAKAGFMHRKYPGGLFIKCELARGARRCWPGRNPRAAKLTLASCSSDFRDGGGKMTLLELHAPSVRTADESVVASHRPSGLRSASSPRSSAVFHSFAPPG